MESASNSNHVQPYLENRPVNFLDLVLAVSRHLRLIIILTFIILLIAIINYIKGPVSYASHAKLMIIEFVDKTNVLVDARQNRVLVGKRQGHWVTADEEPIREILMSSKLKSALSRNGSLTKYTDYSLTVTHKETAGVVGLTIINNNQEATKTIADAVIEELGRSAFQIGLLSSPVPVVDNVTDESGGATMLLYLLEAPGMGTPVRASIFRKIILPTFMGICFILCIVFILDYFQNLSKEDRQRIVLIKYAIRGNKEDDIPPSE